jgi:hypothetical protein
MERSLRRYLPLAVVAVVVVVVVAVVSLGGNDEGTTGDGQGAAAGYRYRASWGEEIVLPEGVVPYSVAEAEGLDVDWPATCDTSTGRVRMPTVFAPECYAPFDGDNGGATAQGVTSDTIRVVLYEAPDNDPILKAVAGAVTEEKPADTVATYEQFLPLFEAFHETYGRKVELVVYKGTGSAIDEVAARAAAAEIAEELQPFAVWGGPLLAPSFEDELSARGVIAMPIATLFEDLPSRDPFLISTGIAPWQTRAHLVEYIGKRLSGRPAEHAGDPVIAARQRTFGLIYLEVGDFGSEEEFRRELGEYDVDLAASASFPSPLGVAPQAPGIIARMKDAGVTSVILSGDPLTPAAFTREATAQGWFPEWIIPGAPLTDSTVYARTYDQRQWSHAFGISALVARTAPEQSLGGRLFRWFNCAAPPADTTELIFPVPAMFFSALQGAGPNLTPQTFRQALFSAEPTTQGVTYPSLSFGDPRKGGWQRGPDLWGSDDVVELWWDAEATGPDETGDDGTGMYSYVDGGRRYRVGQWPAETPGVFDRSRSVALFTETPAEDRGPSYPSPCGG